MNEGGRGVGPALLRCTGDNHDLGTRMNRSENYPASVQEILDPAMRFKPAVLRAVRTFAASRPWRGSVAERRTKFRRLHRALARIYRRPAARLIFGGMEDEDSGRSCFIPRLDVIVLRGRLSVVT